MIKSSINIFLTIWILSGCHTALAPDGLAIEHEILTANNLAKSFDDAPLIDELIKDINCAASTIIGKKLVLAKDFNSSDTSQILLIPFISNGKIYKSSAYSDVKNRIVLINPSYIRDFTLNNTLNDTISYKPVLELMLLHELGHFILKMSGAFDSLENKPGSIVGEQNYSGTKPEYSTSLKRIELSADSLAIDLVKRKLNSRDYDCFGIAFDIQRIVPGMQFTLSGKRIIERFGDPNIGFLRDPSNDYPNLELRITFMNYFLFPNDSLKKMIDDYIYNRTVAPVHRQELDPRIFQGGEKKLSGN